MKRAILQCLLFLSGTLGYAQWSIVGNGFDHGVRSLAYDEESGKTYAFGSFTMTGDQLVNGTAYWNNSSWNPMGLGVVNPHVFNVVSAIVLGGDSILISGFFQAVHGVPDTKHTALWNGESWRSIGPGGTRGIAWGMLANEDGITLAGQLDTVAGLDVNHMARFQNGVWSSLCSYPSDQGFIVYSAVARFQGQYIFGGNVNVAGLREIGYLDGDTLRQLGSGVGGDSWVNDMVEFDDKLFVAGEFYTGGGNAASGVMTWDGTAWADPFPGMEFVTQVVDLDVRNGELFLSGRSMLPGSADYYTLARYNREQICLFGKNLNTVFTAIASTGIELFAAPNMITLGLGGDTVNCIVRYDLDYPADTCFAIAIGISETPGPTPNWRVRVDPIMHTFVLHSVQGSSEPSDIEIRDAIGRLLRIESIPTIAASGSYTRPLPPCEGGTYTLTIRSKKGGRSETIRFVLTE